MARSAWNFPVRHGGETAVGGGGGGAGRPRPPGGAGGAARPGRAPPPATAVTPPCRTGKFHADRATVRAVLRHAAA
ncbi:hypothetical protein, partial [Nocardia abscessus]|uniref:hypothetical protein n=1 Tax=Nocardia abscessus TaxID=120957 RepID=UPI0024586E7B